MSTDFVHEECICRHCMKMRKDFADPEVGRPRRHNDPAGRVRQEVAVAALADFDPISQVFCTPHDESGF